jgi:hypothetical protein
MHTFGRVFAPVAVAAVVMAGPVVFGASSASAAQPAAVSGVRVHSRRAHQLQPR